MVLHYLELKGTAKYYSEMNININSLENDDIYNKIKEGYFGLVINISSPEQNKNLDKTHGYYIRRLSIDYYIDIIINIKCAKLYIDSIISCYNNSKLLVTVM